MELYLYSPIRLRAVDRDNVTFYFITLFITDCLFQRRFVSTAVSVIVSAVRFSSSRHELAKQGQASKSCHVEVKSVT